LLYYPPVPISKQFIVFGLEITFLWITQYASSSEVSHFVVLQLQ
jgi:hypothetical protein